MRPLPALLLTCSCALLGAQTAPPGLAPTAERFRAEEARTHGAYTDLAWLCDRETRTCQ